MLLERALDGAFPYRIAAEASRRRGVLFEGRRPVTFVTLSPPSPTGAPAAFTAVSLSPTRRAGAAPADPAHPSCRIVPAPPGDARTSGLRSAISAASRTPRTPGTSARTRACARRRDHPGHRRPPARRAADAHRAIRPARHDERARLRPDRGPAGAGAAGGGGHRVRVLRASRGFDGARLSGRRAGPPSGRGRRQQAIREILSQSQSRRSTTTVISCSTAPFPGRRRRCGCPRCRAPASGSARGVLVPDQRRGGAISVNGAGPDRLDRFSPRVESSSPARHHQGLAPGLARRQRAPPRPRSESDFYLRLLVPYRARNGNLRIRPSCSRSAASPGALLRRGRPSGLGDLVTALGSPP